ncbi:CD1375 family protein [Halalkalibacter oceani]
MSKAKIIEAYKALVQAGRRSLENDTDVPAVPHNIREDVRQALENE